MQYLQDRALSPEDRTAFRQAVKELKIKYSEHIGIEDSEVFPLAERLLSESEKSAIAREMAQRRNITPATH